MFDTAATPTFISCRPQSSTQPGGGARAGAARSAHQGAGVGTRHRFDGIAVEGGAGLAQPDQWPPGKLTMGNGITGALCREDVYSPRLFLEDVDTGAGRSVRINVDCVGESALKEWRFCECGNRFVSVRPRQ